MIGPAITLLAWVVGGVVFYVSARSRGVEARDGLAVVLVGVAVGVFSAHFVEMLFAHVPFSRWFDPSVGGKAWLGGLLGGWVGVRLVQRHYGMSLSLGPDFAVALPIGEAVGRVGCHFNQCCYGTICALPWAVSQHGAMRHPAQLYSAAISIGIFATLLLRRRRVRDLFGEYLLLMSVTRFGLEFVRERDLVLGSLSAVQLACLMLAAFAVHRLRVQG